MFLNVPLPRCKAAMESLPKCELRDSPGKGEGVFTLEPVKT